MLAPLAHILPLTTIRREQLLPLPGRVTVREGQKVNPTDVVAEAKFGANHILIDVAKKLEMPPAEAQKLIQINAGEVISKGDVIAKQKGFMSQTITCPYSGRVL